MFTQNNPEPNKKKKLNKYTFAIAVKRKKKLDIYRENRTDDFFFFFF